VQLDYTIICKHRQLFAEDSDIQFISLSPGFWSIELTGEIFVLEPCPAVIRSPKRVCGFEYDPQILTVPSRQGGRPLFKGEYFVKNSLKFAEKWAGALKTCTFSGIL
jgi:hypothetical protein